MNDAFATRLREVHDVLLAMYGPQNWWPARSAFEVMVGAVLVQNTTWNGAARAVAALRNAGYLAPEAILAASPAVLARFIRSAGFLNVKTRRLRNLCRWLVSRGGIARLRAVDTAQLRHELLAVRGIGPETADAILLYAFRRPVFVIDAYLRRVLGRIGLIDPKAGYETLRDALETALGPDEPLYNEYHALLVEHGKRTCRTKPRCEACMFREQCAFACGLVTATMET